MDQGFYTVEEAAAALKLHVKTVRRYLREGRLKGTRVGKQYRIARADFDAFAGSATDAESPMRRTRQVEVSSVVQIDAISRDAASRVTNGVLGATRGRPDGDSPLRIHTLYDEERARLKVIITGSAATTAALLGLINLYLEGQP